MVEVDNPGFFYVFDLPAPVPDEEYLFKVLWRPYRLSHFRKTFRDTTKNVS